MKKLSILALCFIGLAAFVYFYEIQGEEEREKAEELEQSLFRLEKDQITGLEIESEGKTTVALSKQTEEWSLREPLETLADNETVDSFLSTLTSVKRDRSFEDVAEKLSEFGLAEPSAKLVVSLSDSKLELLVGTEDFTGSKVYVKFSDSDEVFLTGNTLATSMVKDLYDWRNKDALRFNRNDVKQIELSVAGHERIQISKVEDSWQLVHPFQEPADDASVGGLLSSLEFAEVQSFIDSEEQNLSEYDLDDPAITVKILEEGQEKWHQLELGGSQNEENYYARDAQLRSLFTLKKEVFDDLNQDAWHFRNKDVVDVKQDEIAYLTIQGLADDIRLRREDFKWIMELPEGLKEKEAASYKFWYPIDEIEFISIEEGEPQLQSGVITVGIELNDETTRTFKFAQDGEDCVALKVESGRWGKISREDFDKLQIQAEDITEQ
jgi:hypothetical protein